jgi:hypothetical protein
VAEGPNEVLTSLLDELGWSPRALARRINHVFGSGTVADTVSRELGHPVTTAELWQGRASGSPLALPADIDMDGPWSRASTLGLIDDWVVAGLLDRRHFLAVSGTTILDLATRYPTGGPGRLATALERGSIGTLPLAQTEQSIPLLQRLNDTHGGGVHLPYVGAQFRAVALLLRQGGHPTRVERRLFAALAEIGQLAGWMALDAGQHGLAQRYLFSALRAAREADYLSIAAHVLADLALQAATREHANDAVALGHAAVRIATASPAAVRALAVYRSRRAGPSGADLHDRQLRGHAPERGPVRPKCPGSPPACQAVTRCTRNEYVRDFLPTLDAAVARQPVPA